MVASAYPFAGGVWTSWTGCSGYVACLHYREGEEGDALRPTALCRACSGAWAKRERALAALRKEEACR